MLDIRTMKALYNSGAIISSRLYPAPMQNGWHLVMVTREGSEEILTKARTETPRLLKTPEMAKKVAEDIGVKELTWVF